MPPSELRQLAGILAGAYTCGRCNSPSAAAICEHGAVIPVCAEHARQAERDGRPVIWKQPKVCP